MAKELGFRNLKQTTYLNQYSPQAYLDEVAYNLKMRKEMVRLVEASDNLGFRFVNQRDSDKQVGTTHTF